MIRCNDYAVIPLQGQRERLYAGTTWYLINDHAFEIAFDKAATSQLARKLEIRTPTEWEFCGEALNQVKH